ncbi:hypothetical protein H8E88_15085 [candidate division KSB1 bacterium]|nr:hypothetical protein [candidate division KSB1 bacterium]
MEKRLKTVGMISLILGIISSCWLVYNFFIFQTIQHQVTNFELSGTSERLIKYIFIGFIVSFFFHISALVNIIFQFQYFKKVTFLKLITLFIGVLSFICLIGDWAALSDIGKQYQMALSTSTEWSYLYISLIPHVLFHLLLFMLLASIFRELKTQQEPEFVLKDEIIFRIAQYIGLLCGIIGFGFTLIILVMNIQPHILKYIIPFYCSFIVFPYCLILFYWLMLKRTQKISDWYDEKQSQDIARASLTTILLSIPGMALLFLINYFLTGASISIIWFPYYLFIVLPVESLFFMQKFFNKDQLLLQRKG